MYCREENYQKRLALLLAEVRRRPEVSTVVPPGLLALPKRCEHLYCVANQLYWAHKSFFESCDPEREKILRGAA